VTDRHGDFEWARLGDEAVELLRDYLRIDTTNPPGNESEGVAFLARVLTRDDVPFETAEPAPGRGNLVARLAGSGAQPGLVLHHHIDVVPADRRHWSVDPFGGVVDEGYLYGRGALDMKAVGIVQLMAMLAVKRAGRRLAGDVVLLATADEEDDSELGAEFVARHRSGWLAGAGAALSELGGILDRFELTRPIGIIGVSEKTPLPLRLTARGVPGHGSLSWPDSAPHRLVRALRRLLRGVRTPRVLPETQAFFSTLAAALPDGVVPGYQDLAAALQEPEFRAAFLANPHFAAAVTTTFAVTVVRCGERRNVSPAEAVAEVDCRVLTGDDPHEIVEWVRRRIDDDQVEVEITGAARRPTLSSTETFVYRTLEKALRRRVPNVVVTPAILTGFSDSWVFRRCGLDSYGFSPFVLDESELFRIHGVDERISLENVRAGVRAHAELLLDALGE
jgi:acetylornithine deacetylase/succinyl-diaminopimelate desuccinylase-like protein